MIIGLGQQGTHTGPVSGELARAEERHDVDDNVPDGRLNILRLDLQGIHTDL